ncbi:MAG: YigZ family protein [Marinobacter sp.]|nr:YigZ family protein [Marinobacter sp.]
MSQDYPIPEGFLERETDVRKSRFIARVLPVSSRDDVRAMVARAWADHPDARHVCWAYQIGRPGSAAEAGMNDDGEPSGTAGKPILNVIQHKALGDVAVVVIRYFGGIKLGAGGLVRAYAGATERVLADVGRVVHKPMETVRVAMSFADEQPLRHWCDQHQASLESVEYQVGVSASVRLTVEHVDALIAFCQAHGMDYSLDIR